MQYRNKLEYRKNKRNSNHFYLYQNNYVRKHKQIQEQKLLGDLIQTENDVFDELMKELKLIKRKTTLKRFIQKNKEIIRGLIPDKRNKITKYIKTNFY